MPIKHPHNPTSLSRLLLSSHLTLAAFILITFAGTVFLMHYFATYRKVESELLGAAEILKQELSQGVHPGELKIPDAFFHRFGKARRDHAYWVLWDLDGDVIGSEGEFDEKIRPSPQLPPRLGKHPYITRTHGRHFDLMIATQDSGQLLVGRLLAKEFDGFVRLLVWLIGIVTLGLLVAGLLAWCLTRRIAAPIKRLTDEASRITSSRLNRRLENSQATMEMSDLAAAFNATLEELELAFAKQQQFTSDAAHELRTPVAIVASQCELTLSRARNDDYYRAALTTCLQASQYMRELVNQLLELSRLDGSEKPADQSVIQYDELTRQVTKLLDSFASHHGVHLESKLDEVSIHASPLQIRQVLFNLIANAIQFSHPDGVVLISLECYGEMARMTVRDSGIGISAEDVPRVCDRFFRVDQARTRSDSTGSGLGLSIVSEIINVHHGTLTIESQLGGGTTVRVDLPAWGVESNEAVIDSVT